MPVTSSLSSPEPAPSARRADIEGLRAVAVVAVMLFHLGVPGAGGGYVGVDVFFVVSGFLITGLMLLEHRMTGRLRLLDFYARRSRRILPLATVVLVVAVAAGRILLPPLLRTALEGDARAAALFVANLRFAAVETDYFADTGVPSMFQHYWSLSVEEQFYLVWPVVFVSVAGAARRHGWLRPRVLFALGALAVIASFAASVVVTAADQPWAFFLLPTRAWELGVGGLLAAGAARTDGIRARHPTVFAAVGWGGVAMISGAVVVLVDTASFPGWTALLPVLGTAAAITGAPAAASWSAGRMLGWRPLVWIGGRSFGLYLWHWPLILVLRHGPFTIGDRTAIPVVLAGSAALAVAGRRLVEQPPRRSSRLVGHRGRSLAMGAALVLVGVLATGPWLPPPALATDVIASPPSRPPDPARDATPVVPANLRPTLAHAETDDPPFGSNGCLRQLRQRGRPAGLGGLPCVSGGAAEGPTVVLFGDSHARHWYSALAAVAEGEGWRLATFVLPACSSFFEAPRRSGAENADCEEWRYLVVATLAAEPPDVVVLSASSIGSIRDDPDRFRTAAAAGLDRLATIAPLVVLGDSAEADGSVPVCLSGHVDDAAACAIDPDAEGVNAAVDMKAELAARTGSSFADVRAWLCTDRTCPPILGDVLVYQDSHHVTDQFARMAAPRFRALLLPVVEDGQGP